MARAMAGSATRWDEVVGCVSRRSRVEGGDSRARWMAMGIAMEVDSSGRVSKEFVVRLSGECRRKRRGSRAGMQLLMVLMLL